MTIAFDIARPMPRRGVALALAGLALLGFPAVLDLPTRLV